MSEGGIGVDWAREGDQWWLTVRGIPIWAVLVLLGVVILTVFFVGARIGHRLGRPRPSTPPLGPRPADQPRAPARSAASAKSGS